MPEKPTYEQLEKQVQELEQLKSTLEKREKRYENLEETLIELENKFNTAFRSNPAGMVITRLKDGKVIDVNQSFFKITGYPHEESLGRTSIELGFWIKPEDRELATQKMKAHHGFRDLEFDFRNKSGEIRTGLFSSEIVNIKGEPCIITALNDITKRKKAEENLKQSEEKYYNLFNSVSDAVYVMDRETGKVLDVNDTACKMYGYTREEWLTMTNTDVSAEPEKTKKATKELPDKIPVRFHKKKDGTVFPLEITLGTFYLEGKQAIIAAGRDITERKQAEEKIRKYTEELQRSNKELEQFAYVASHDLQEPLRMVSSYTQLLERRYKDKLDRDAMDFIEFAVDGANRMKKLINDLLEYSRVTTRGKPFKKVDSHLIMGRAIANMQQAIAETAAIVTNDDLPSIWVDESQMVRVFQNLIDNALKFRGRESPRIHVSSQQGDGQWIFSIRDNGIGIEKQYEERVFEIFQRLHGRAEYPGTGIGLAICRRIVQRHGGKIWFESQPGRGTAFYFTISKTRSAP